MDKVPDRLYIDKEDIERYEYVKNKIFDGKEKNKELFLLAMAVGFKNGIKENLEKKEGYVRSEYLSDEDNALLNAVAIYEEGFEVLTDKNKIFKIAEEYAHAGIKLLANEINSLSFGSYPKELEKELIELLKKLSIGREKDEEIFVS